MSTQVKHNPIEAILRSHATVILDGALATELESHGCDLDDPLWSARTLIENPGAISAVHTDYFRGACSSLQTAISGDKEEKKEKTEQTGEEKTAKKDDSDQSERRHRHFIGSGRDPGCPLC